MNNIFEIQVLLLSLRVGFVSVLLSLPFGIYVAWILEKNHFRGKIILQCIVNLPLVLPPVVIGYLLLILLGRNGILGYWLFEWLGFSFSFSWWGAVLASSIVAFPLMVRSIRTSIELLDESHQQVAKTLGASSFKIFFKITLPLLIPGILIGMILAFARAIGEFGATVTFLVLTPDTVQTLPNAIFRLLSSVEESGTVFRLCMISIVISFAALVFSEMLTQWGKKRVGAKAHVKS
ncbi:molybdate ABC transporter permease subunit [Thorsellia kenyensis]|uniref:Molybdenum transport system permease n=1 Tax=Thorsellia kenyensis TaxID=1549888 RepID=A0ABV6CD60_9GAMM